MTIILDTASALQAVLIVGGAVIVAPLMVNAYYWAKKEWTDAKAGWSAMAAEGRRQVEEKRQRRDFIKSRAAERNHPTEHSEPSDH